MTAASLAVAQTDRERFNDSAPIEDAPASTTPLRVMFAYAVSAIAYSLLTVAAKRLPAEHPWRIMQLGCVEIRREYRSRHSFGGILPIGQPEPIPVTCAKVCAWLLLAWLALSVMFNLGGIDLIPFDLVKIAGSDL